MTEMVGYATPDDLFGDDDAAEDVTLPRSGRKVRVRGLSRAEWFSVGRTAEGDGDKAETRTLSLAFVEPKLTEKQADAWRRRPGAQADIAAVTDVIRRLTGIEQGAAKSDVAPAGD